MLAHLNGKKLNWSNFNYSKIKEFNRRDIISSIKYDVNIDSLRKKVQYKYNFLPESSDTNQNKDKIDDITNEKF